MSDDDIIYYGNEDIPEENLLNQTSLIKPNSIYLVVRSAKEEIGNHNEGQYKYASRFHYHVTLEEDYSIVSVGCLHIPVYVIANAPYGDKSWAEDIINYVVMKEIKQWNKFFINCEETEAFGPPPVGI